MAFVREIMTEADHAKLFTQENMAFLRKNCIPQDEWNSCNANVYAIDRERNTVFFNVPKFAPYDTDTNYLLIVDGMPIALLLTSGGETGDAILPFGLPDNLKNRKAEIQQIICDAFVVYGRHGTGDPTSLTRNVIPTFQE